MATISKTPPRFARGRPETDLLFAWLENALGDPIVDTHEFLAAVGRLAELLEDPTFHRSSRTLAPSSPER